jgi:presqualene diphosphate synthase
VYGRVFILSMTETESIPMSAEPTDAELASHVEAIVRKAGTSFFWAMRRLEEDKRNAMYAIYAFCREVDDIADEPGEVEEKRLALGLWRGEIERLYADRPRKMTACALIQPVEKYGLHKEDFRAIIDGMEMDAAPSIRIKDMAELELYNDRVACAVGRLSVRVFGVPEKLGIQLAFAQGQALQLTNILRDIVEDAEQDRLYLPGDLLRSHDIASDDLAALVKHPNLEDICELLANVASRRYAEARELAGQCKRDDVRPAVMMMDVYHQILEKLIRRGWKDISSPVKLSKLEKMWTLLRHGVL